MAKYHIYFTLTYRNHFTINLDELKLDERAVLGPKLIWTLESELVICLGTGFGHLSKLMLEIPEIK